MSSLNKFSKNLDVSWPGYKNTIFKTVKKIKVRIRTLEDFIEKNKINLIRYIHIDTQGNDLKVLKGLKSKINIIQEGKMEAAINKKNAAYINNHTINDVKKFFSKTKLKIFKIIKIKHISDKKIIKNEADIYFINKNFNKINRINLKYNLRYFGRLIYNNTYIKDDILDFFEKLKNKILN